MVVAQYKAGAGIITLARQYGCSEKPIRRILEKHGAHETGRHFRGRYTAEQKQSMRERYQAGESLSDLGRAFACAPSAVRQILKRMGVNCRPFRTPPVDPNLLEVLGRRRNEGWSQQEIAQEVGILQTRVSRLLRLMGFPPEPTRSRSAHGSWRGGRSRNGGGYWLVLMDPDDPLFGMANGTGYALEHRLVMARSLGRPLTRRETVHHINGDRGDNRLENLQLRKGAHGAGVHMACMDCGSRNVEAMPLGVVAAGARIA